MGPLYELTLTGSELTAIWMATDFFKRMLDGNVLEKNRLFTNNMSSMTNEAWSVYEAQQCEQVINKILKAMTDRNQSNSLSEDQQ